MASTESRSAPKMPKVAKVKNKSAAKLQVTAEQLLREAKERQLEIVAAPPKQKIADEVELADFQLRKRKEFEDGIRKSRTVMSNWFKYASWEETQKDIRRARSVYERALDVDHRNISLWIKYAEMEMRNKQVNHARNLWDRSVTIMPRVNQFWYKYTYMEEMLGNIPGCREVFERWMKWEPEEQPWLTYVKFEIRYKELDRAREIYQRFVYVHPEIKNWIRYAKFENAHGFVNSSREVYVRAVDFFNDENHDMDETLFIAFAKFEESHKEHDRCRAIYKYALDRMPQEKAVELYKAYTIHEKKYGERSGIESVILRKRRLQYEEEIAENPNNYDAWFDFIRLMESDGDVEAVREVYERAIANVPPSKQKQYWRRYIYLWINYAVYEELEAQDMERARQVYHTALSLVPHRVFTFAKLWLLYAQFEIRQKDIKKARSALGSALGKCKKAKLFRGYIDLEIQLREFQRCRLLYEKFIEYDPENCTTWMKFAELETLLGDMDRARAIYELAVNQPRLDMPEVLWKSYIDFEIDQDETDRARDLYQRLLNRTQHIKVWMSYAQFELNLQHEDHITQARHIYEEANKSLRVNNQPKEQRFMLLEAWLEFERETGSDEASIKCVQKLLPQKVKKRRKIEEDEENGGGGGWEEYFDYIFPEDQSAQPNLKLLAMAKMWKKKQMEEEKDVDTDRSEESAVPKTEPESPANSKADSPTPSQENTTVLPDNPDADDEQIKNESSSDSSSSSEDED